MTSLRKAASPRSTNTIDRPSGSQPGQLTVFGSARNTSSLVPVLNRNRRIPLPPSASVEYARRVPSWDEAGFIVTWCNPGAFSSGMRVATPRSTSWTAMPKPPSANRWPSRDRAAVQISNGVGTASSSCPR
jgi:hypothetical protein